MRIIFLFLLANIIISNCFISTTIQSNFKKLTKSNLQIKECGERLIYKNYLIGLRKTKRYLNASATADTIVSIFNITNNFMPNNNVVNINNTDMVVKNIIVGNIILNVSNVKYIHISTSKEKIILELDKVKQTDTNILEQINNIDSILSTISILGKIMNIN